MKKILFHSLTIPPDNVSTGMLVAEIADGFKELGVDVEILASSPQYNIENSTWHWVHQRVTVSLWESY